KKRHSICRGSRRRFSSRARKPRLAKLASAGERPRKCLRACPSNETLSTAFERICICTAMPLPNVVDVRSQTLLKECLGCQDLGETIGGEEFKSRGGGRGKPP